MKNLRLVVLAIMAVVTLSGCSSDPASMWNSKYAFKTVGQVMAMCDSGDTSACYAARDMASMQVGLGAAADQINQQQALQAQQQAAMQAQQMQALRDANRTVTCRPGFGDSVQCTGF
ncbi:hypothetical protein GFM72_21175 [Salmonella enterica]|nr:hypothetical protein [Salmonella enterica]